MKPIDFNDDQLTRLCQMVLYARWLLSVQVWLNEKFSPDLLPHHSEIVDCMVEQLSVMQHNIDRARKADLKVSIHKMEVRLIIAVLAFVTSKYFKI